jgi:hypothetical protein
LIAAQGYYGLIQYLPRPERLEAVNLGVYLVCPALGFSTSMLVPEHCAIRRRFPTHDFRPVRLHADIRAMAGRVAACTTAGELTLLQARSYGHVMITAPLSMAVDDPLADLWALYQDLVEP